MKIQLQTLFDKLSESHSLLYLPEDLLKRYNSMLLTAIINGTDRYVEVEIPDNTFELIEEKRQSDLKKKELYQTISQYRLDGMDIEKTDIDKAIECYKKSIELGEGTNMFYAYAHSYKRIIVLFRKAKNYKDEILYCSKFLEHELSDSERAKYSERLSKLKNKYGELE